LCAVVTANLHFADTAETLTRAQVIRALKTLKKEAPGQYLTDALRYLEQEWDTEILERLVARKGLAKTVRAFLFSEAVATKLRRERSISGGAGEREGYTLRPSNIEPKTIENPLQFLRVYAASTTAHPAEALWILYVLAFYVKSYD
jgi:hypothetical protein